MNPNNDELLLFRSAESPVSPHISDQWIQLYIT